MRSDSLKSKGEVRKGEREKRGREEKKKRRKKCIIEYRSKNFKRNKIKINIRR